MKLTLALQVAGLVHLGLLAAGAMMPRAVDLPRHIVGLPPFIRRLFWVYYTFIGMSLVSFGLASFFLADELASGTVLARAVCGFLALFWCVRLVAALLVFDLRPYLTSFPRKLGYHALNIIFALLPVIYLWGAFTGGGR